jgi:hypothetical protein
MRWMKRDAGLSIQLEAPRGTEGYIGIPSGNGRRRIELDGRQVAAGLLPSGTPRAGYVYIGPLSAGSHSVSSDE